MDGLQPVSLDPLRVAVLSGGQSAERKVSLQSGEAVSIALRSRGHNVTDIDPAVVDLGSYDWTGTDVAFLALHGTFGEDGGVQSVLEQLGVTFTGSGLVASKLAFSKSAAKERFLQSGVPTPEYAVIHETDSLEHIAEKADAIGYPLVVKPDAQGSSIGVSIVRSAEELQAALSQCFYFDSFGLLERAIESEEWTLGVIDDQPLPLIRIGTGRTFFDFEAKYEDDTTQYEFPKTDDSFGKLLIDTSLSACRSLGTEGVARVDLMVDETGRPWVLEVNTIPGMTDHSLVPKSAAHAGLSFCGLCELIMARSLECSRDENLRRAS